MSDIVMSKTPDSETTLDWLSFNFFVSDDRKAHFEKIGEPIDVMVEFRHAFPEFNCMLEEGIILDWRQAYYEYVLQWNDNIRISFDSDKLDKGVNVMVPSHGLHWLFECLFPNDKSYDVRKLLRTILERGCHVNRLDIACDDFTRKFTPKYYAEKMTNGEICSKFRWWSFMSSCSGKGADTIYFGKRDSNKYVRIYDKEVESDGEIKSIRYEIELKKSQAQSMAQYLAFNDDLDLCSYWVNNIFRVIVRTHSINNRNLDQLDPEWELFVKSVL